MTAAKNIVNHSFLMTTKQNDELMELAKSMDCDNVPELFNKLIEFSKAMSRGMIQGFEIVMVDPTKMETHEAPDGRVMWLFKSKEHFSYVNNEITELLSLHKEIAKTTNFGMPGDPGLA
jgi:hypothetical protein